MRKIKLHKSKKKGRLGVLHLLRMWSMAILKTKGITPEVDKDLEWKLNLIIIDGLRLGLEETTKYLYQTTPSYEEFENWIVKTNGGNLKQEAVDSVNKAIKAILKGKEIKDDFSNNNDVQEQVLNTEDLKFWEKNGYIIVKNAVSKEDCNAAKNAIWEFLNADPNNPDSWYKNNPAKQGIMVKFIHNKALEKNRQSAKIRVAFEQLWNRKNLIVSTDRVGFNPPERFDYRFPGPNLHWDTSINLPIPLSLQGILYLVDVEENQGAFTCVPGFHNKIDEWINNLPAGVDPREEDLNKLGAKPIAAKAGDFIIWHHALPHGSRPNTAGYPRIVQYIKWYPPDYEDRRPWK